MGGIKTMILFYSLNIELKTSENINLNPTLEIVHFVHKLLLFLGEKEIRVCLIDKSGDLCRYSIPN